MKIFSRHAIDNPLMMILLTAMAASAAEVRVRVRDANGAAIRAHVVVRADSFGRDRSQHTDITEETDNRGLISLNVPDGFYDVCVMADSFSPHCEKILVKSGGRDETVITLRLDSQIKKKLVF